MKPAKKSTGAQRRKTVLAKKKSTKGWKTHKAKGRKLVEYGVENATSKAINKKNEAIVSSKAIGNGSRFFLSDIKETGKKEMDKQNRSQSKRENKRNAKNMDNRLKAQIEKLGLKKK
eukprot:CAMPEP_0195511616 /NCGR_PEP_ID=MMETSP0794_2-20130614/3880_1 /TAXON_ID=515487 /ORGANISM="Stephanopyxis turris, Strain CCMP 815" /LENGTH=116 /DNA_ID=CAMNT_0040639259 /DNA_START=160 /DNA_END=513 /DNA_ORIENTATION=+